MALPAGSCGGSCSGLWSHEPRQVSQAPRPPAAPSLGFVSGSGGVTARCTGRVRVVLNNAPER